MKILIVDDQDILRKSVILHLEFLYPYALIRECTSGLESLNATDEFRPDIIFMDVSMPLMNGIQATALIRSKYPAQKIIAFSMNDTMEMANKMLNAGALAYLLKTDSMDDFQKAIKEVLNDGMFISRNIMAENDKG